MCPQCAPWLGLGLSVTRRLVSGRIEMCGKDLQYFLSKRHICCSMVAAAGLAQIWSITWQQLGEQERGDL